VKLATTVALHKWLNASTLLVGATSFWSGFVFRTEAEKILFTAMFAAIVLDIITGIAASYKEGKAISSSRMRDAIPKLIGYMAFILMSILVGQVMKTLGAPIPPEAVVTGATGLVFSIEAHSVLENVHRLTGMKTQWLMRWLKGRLDEQTRDEADEPRIRT
jgi:hypothetical protein